ncbi:MAG: FtsX-like permease family protein [Pseudomonadota bacterium]
MSVATDRASAAAGRATGGSGATLPLVLRLALRELRSGLSGFGIFIACIALGVAVITGIGTLADGLLNGFSQQGRTLLGGDVTASRIHKRATPEELGKLKALGRVSEAGLMRSMARVPAKDDQTLVEIKAVDNAYPLVGQLTLASGRPLDAVLNQPATAVVAKGLLDRLGLKPGDSFELGGTPVTIADVITNEPDKIGARLAFGPRVLMSIPSLEATGLVQPGTLIRWRYAVADDAGAAQSADGLTALKATVGDDLRKEGFIIQDRTNPSPSVTRTIDRLRQFLSLLGLTALLVGGVGVANAVNTFVERRRASIATYKSVGASQRTVFAVLLTQIMMIASVGIAIGLAIGIAVPLVVPLIIGDNATIPLVPIITPWTLIIGTLYGLLIALLFTIWPLGQAERVKPAALFRDDVGAGDGARVLPGKVAIILTALVASGLVALTYIASGTPRISLGFLAGVSVILALFWLLGTAVTWAARRMARPRRPELALAITGLAAPGGLTRSVVLSLGAGLSLLVAVALVDRSLVAELEGRLPENSPNFFALDINKRDLGAFTKDVTSVVADASVRTAPMLRGRIVELNGVAADKANAPPEAEWVLRGDRGLSFAEELPEGSKIVAGDWWPKGYSGEPQVSFVDTLARDLGLKIGDTVTVNVLGRNITARIANLRQIDWESLSINFVMVFSPNTLEAAPYNVLATITLPKTATVQQEAEIGRAVGRSLPSVTMIRVRDAIEAFAGVFGSVMLAVRAAGSVTLIAGALVLAGALATAQRRRILQAVILKCIGATRRKLLTAHVVEYGLLALIAAGLAILLGTIAAYIVTAYVLEVSFTLSWSAIAIALIGSLGLILAFGAIGTWRVLEARPVQYLRTL